jgi:hypothetical protein
MTLPVVVDVGVLTTAVESVLAEALVPDDCQVVTQELYDPPADACPVVFVIPTELTQQPETLQANLLYSPYYGRARFELHAWTFAAEVKVASQDRLRLARRIQEVLRQDPTLGGLVIITNVLRSQFLFRPPTEGSGQSGLYAGAIIEVESQVRF